MLLVSPFWIESLCRRRPWPLIQLGHDANPVDWARARAHFGGHVGNQFVERLGIEAVVAGPHLEAGLDDQDDAPFGAVDFPFEPAAAQFHCLVVPVLRQPRRRLPGPGLGACRSPLDVAADDLRLQFLADLLGSVGTRRYQADAARLEDLQRRYADVALAALLADVSLGHRQIDDAAHAATPGERILRFTMSLLH